MRLVPFDGPVWRLIPAHLASSPNSPASAPEGRFHHSGQTAVYASLTAEGTRVAMQRYLTDGVPRVLVPMRLTAQRVADIRGIENASIVWQDLQRDKEPLPTWSYSDSARLAGAEAMLYSSRSRPELSHVVVFKPRCLSATDPIPARGSRGEPPASNSICAQ